MKKLAILTFLLSILTISGCGSNTENEFSMAEKCHDYNNEFNQRINNEWEGSYNYEIIETSVFYSSKLNSCIGRYEILQNDNRYHLMQDILNGETIYQCKDGMRWSDRLGLRKDDELQKEDCVYSKEKVLNYLK